MNSPVVQQGGIVAGVIILLRILVSMAKAFHWVAFDPDQDAVISNAIETGIPIIAVMIGALWAARKVTPLAAPKDIDNTPLTRADNTPAILELEQKQKEAIKINDKIDEIDERRINRGN